MKLNDLEQARIWYFPKVGWERHSACLYETRPSKQWLITDSMGSRVTLAHYEDGQFQWVYESRELWDEDPEKAKRIYRFPTAQEAIDFYVNNILGKSHDH